MAFVGVLLPLAAVAFAAFYFYAKSKHSYWAKKGVFHEKPNLLFGNLADVFLAKKSLFDLMNDAYEKYPKERVVGLYAFTKPILVIRDLDILKDILIKDFKNFPNRSFKCDEHGDPLGYELMFGKWDDDWRQVRNKSAFAFSSGKMKKMYPLVTKVGRDINQLCNEKAKTEKSEVNIRNISNRYAVDVITSCAFGSQAGAISTPDTSVMFRVLNDIFQLNYKEGIASNLMFFHRSLYAFVSRLGLGFKIFKKQVEDDVYKVVDTAAKERLQSGERRGDIFDEIVFSDAPVFQGLKKKAGAAFQMLLAGSETSSSTIVFTLYCLAKYPHVQKKLQNEIREVLKKHNGEIPYDVLNIMDYLDQVFKESVRLYPILPFLDRIAARDYHIAGTDIIIEKGVQVFIPMWALHKDPNYFPDPLAFKPERFSKETGHSFPEMAYMPFGAGPRYCIGKRFGIMSVKSFLVHVLKDFDIYLSDYARRPLEWNKKSFTLNLQNGMSLVLSPSKPQD